MGELKNGRIEGGRFHAFQLVLVVEPGGIQPAVMRCLLMIHFAVKIGEREILHLSYAIDTKRKTYERLSMKVASRGFSAEFINRPESRTFKFEPVGFRRAKRIKAVRECIYPAPA